MRGDGGDGRNERSEHVLVVKYPVRGAVKCRLAAGVGSRHATELYRLFVLDILGAFRRASLSPIVCHHPPGAAGAFRRWLGPRQRLLAQRGGDHPGRMMHAFEDLFAAGADRVVMFVSDVPDLSSCLIGMAGRALERADAVLGPSGDGGYYVIGFRRGAFVPGAFTGVPWSSERTFRETARRIREAGWRLRVLPPCNDVDKRGDLRTLSRRNRATAFRRSRTMGYLRRHPGLLAPDKGGGGHG